MSAVQMQTVVRGGKRFVLVPERRYEKLIKAAAETAALPPLPKPDAKGRVDAIEYARASIARHLIADRQAAGLTQQELANRAGVRQETISRIESGKHTASVRIMDKIARALGQ